MVTLSALFTQKSWARFCAHILLTLIFIAYGVVPSFAVSSVNAFTAAELSYIQTGIVPEGFVSIAVNGVPRLAQVSSAAPTGLTTLVSQATSIPLSGNTLASSGIVSASSLDAVGAFSPLTSLASAPARALAAAGAALFTAGALSPLFPSGNPTYHISTNGIANYGDCSPNNSVYQGDFTATGIVTLVPEAGTCYTHATYADGTRVAPPQYGLVGYTTLTQTGTTPSSSGASNPAQTSGVTAAQGLATASPTALTQAIKDAGGAQVVQVGSAPLPAPVTVVNPRTGAVVGQLPAGFTPTSSGSSPTFTPVQVGDIFSTIAKAAGAPTSVVDTATNLVSSTAGQLATSTGGSTPTLTRSATITAGGVGITFIMNNSATFAPTISNNFNLYIGSDSGGGSTPNYPAIQFPDLPIVPDYHSSLTTENFFSHALTNLSNKFPLDILGNLSSLTPSLISPPCPSITSWGVTQEVCIIRDLPAALKYPVWLSWSIYLVTHL